MSVRDQYASHRSFTLTHEGHMRITHHHSAALVGFAAMMTLGCDASTAPKTGAIKITISTAGASIDVDPDGYSLSIDGRLSTVIGPNDVITIGDLAPGNYLVRLEGLATNCSVTGNNPVSVDVVDGDKSASPVGVAFSVSCIGTGSIQVTT